MRCFLILLAAGIAQAFSVIPSQMSPFHVLFPCTNFTASSVVQDAVDQIHQTNTFHLEFVPNVSFPHVRNGLSTICLDNNLQLNVTRWDTRYREIDVSTPKSKILMSLLMLLGLGPSLSPGIMNGSNCDSQTWLSLDDVAGLAQSFRINVLQLY